MMSTMQAISKFTAKTDPRSLQSWDHPRNHVRLQHREDAHQGREDEAVDDDAREDLTLAADGADACRADGEVLRADHLAHDARGTVGGAHEHRVEARDLGRRGLERTEEGVRRGVTAGEEHADHAEPRG